MTTPKQAMEALGLTGTGDFDTLTINLEAGQSVTLRRADVPSWPDGKELRHSTVVIGGIVFQVSYAMKIMNVAIDYFAMMAAGV